jgi:predicted small secreted protein
MTMIKSFLAIALLAGAIISFTGCRTAHGFGEDMEKAGDKIQEKTQ